MYNYYKVMNGMPTDKERKAYNKANPDNKIKIVQAIKYRSDFDVIYASTLLFV